MPTLHSPPTTPSTTHHTPEVEAVLVVIMIMMMMMMMMTDLLGRYGEDGEDFLDSFMHHRVPEQEALMCIQAPYHTHHLIHPHRTTRIRMVGRRGRGRRRRGWVKKMGEGGVDGVEASLEEQSGNLTSLQLCLVMH